MRWGRKHKGKIWKGAVAGMAGGLAASWVMNQFQAVWSKAAEVIQGNGQRGPEQQSGDGEDATMKIANKIAATVLRRELTKEEQQTAGPVVHYTFGALMGGVYGASVEVVPKLRSGFGLPYGTAVFVGADEVAVPALGLSKSPAEYPISTHAYALASHLVYGATLELVRRGVRRLL
ncbi:MAG TPA: DUF1440 domain-containing protein [Terriglobales bacterium]|jgi:hypothetical protein|nr:DUF1440 domain-containing protein [Terriglobales bacterium]